MDKGVTLESLILGRRKGSIQTSTNPKLISAKNGIITKYCGNTMEIMTSSVEGLWEACEKE